MNVISKSRTPETGYFANESRATKVHLVQDGNPLCGSQIHDDMKYQWCSPRVERKWVDCQRCLDILSKREKDEGSSPSG